MSLPQITQQGLTDEVKVKGWLRRNGYFVKESTSYENSRLDIDAWVLTPKDRNWDKFIPISIKSSHRSAAFNHFGVEVDTQIKDNDGTLKWTGSSWFQNGKARFYIVYQGNDLFVVDKAKFSQYRSLKLILPERITTLSYDVKRDQAERGHPHVDTKSEYYSRTSLLEKRIMKRIGTIR